MEEAGTRGGPLRRGARRKGREALPRALASIGATLILAAGCGGGGGETEKARVDTQAVETAVNEIDEACIKAGSNPKAVDSGISVHVDHLVEAYEADPKASLDATDLRAHTVEEVFGDVAETLEDCRPEDALRVKEVLAKP